MKVTIKILYLYILIFLIFSLFSSLLSAQTGRGVRLGNETQNFSANTKLVVIGVSKYLNIQSLNYAHTDALSFYNYMISPEGGKVDVTNSKILLNEKATAANIFESLNWLVDQTKENERVIFYFAGHGDLENKTMFQNGFLLANDAPVAAYMAGGTIGVTYLQQYLTTLVQKNKAQVILITDACHSGKLAGGMEGAANTTTALQGNWENTIKILSSQPGELSQEGKKWNNGGGVFTYYLVKGLMGFADRNHDNKITVNEINIYLNDHIPSETNFTQNPSILGNSSAVISTIDSATFAKIVGSDKNFIINNSEVAMRGVEEDLKSKMDTDTYATYLKFKYCLSVNYLSGDHPGYGNAVDLYYKLRDGKKAEIVIHSVKSSLIAALQNPSQIFMNRIIAGKGPEADTIPFGDVYYGIETAFLLSDTTDISYNNIKARYLFIKASLAASSPQKDEEIRLLGEVIKTDPDFAPAYYMRGEVMRRFGRNEEALLDFQKSLELCPNWSFANISIAGEFIRLKEFDKAIACYEKAIASGSEDGDLYYDLGGIYTEKKNNEKAILYYHKAIDFYLNSIAKNQNDFEIYYSLACVYSLIHENENAVKYLELSFQKGWENFNHIEKDSDLDNIRNTKEFKNLIKKYSK